MDNFQEVFADQDHYDDGIIVDYATMVRMWSSLDRSLTTFNRKCGVITLRPWKEPAGGMATAKKGPG